MVQFHLFVVQRQCEEYCREKNRFLLCGHDKGEQSETKTDGVVLEMPVIDENQQRIEQIG
jgi:hypothetical protein